MSNVPQSSVNSAKKLASDQLLIRINGTLPDIETLGSVEKSERAAEVKQYAINTNTSCSFFALDSKEPNQIFHMLVDVGQGIVKSIEKGISDLGFDDSLSSIIPDALLITHSHEDHIRELSLLAEKAIEKPGRLIVYCTTECRDQILDRYPQLSSMIKNNQLSFTILQPGENFDVGPFSVMPILSYHGENSPPGSVIYILQMKEEKMREKLQESSHQNTSALTPQFIEIESLQNYIFRIENEPKADKLKLMIEDSVNRYNLEFDRPRRLQKTDDSDEKEIIVAQGVKGMLTKGPDLKIEIEPRLESDYVINTRASKGKKKHVFNDEILISTTDADRLKKYIKHNFRVYNAPATAK
jgi:hypothetical protein